MTCVPKRVKGFSCFVRFPNSVFVYYFLFCYFIFYFGGGSRIGEIRERTNRQVHIVQFPVLDSNSKNYFFFVVCVSLTFFLSLFPFPL